MAQEKNSKNFNFLPEAIIAALIPIYGYYFTYRYDTGFFKEFNIPTSFIEVSISDVLRVLGWLFTLIIIFYLRFIFELALQKIPLLEVLDELFSQF